MTNYILKKDCPNIGKEVGDYYNGEYGESEEKIKELLEKGTIEIEPCSTCEGTGKVRENANCCGGCEQCGSREEREVPCPDCSMPEEDTEPTQD